MMSDAQALFGSPHLIDVLLGFVVLEAAGLILWRRHRARAASPGDGAARRSGGGREGAALEIIVLLLPGVFLMLAIRAALAGSAWPWVPASLAASLGAHAMDIHLRWNRR